MSSMKFIAFALAIAALPGLADARHHAHKRHSAAAAGNKAKSAEAMSCPMMNGEAMPQDKGMMAGKGKMMDGGTEMDGKSMPMTSCMATKAPDGTK